MTLNTRFFALDPVDAKELFHFGQEMLAKLDDHQRPASAQAWSDEAKQIFLGPGKGFAPDPDGRREIANRLGQGLPAIWEVRYREGGMYRTPEEAAQHDEDCDSDCDGTGWAHRTPCWAEMSLDTAYGYSKDVEGIGHVGCSELHVLMLKLFHGWLSERGVRMGWINEYTGDYHVALDGLDSLSSAGFEAMAWFHTLVVPAVHDMVEREGGVMIAGPTIPRELPY